jgi:hypothetical protein
MVVAKTIERRVAGDWCGDVNADRPRDGLPGNIPQRDGQTFALDASAWFIGSDRAALCVARSRTRDVLSSVPLLRSTQDRHVRAQRYGMPKFAAMTLRIARA